MMMLPPALRHALRQSVPTGSAFSFANAHAGDAVDRLNSRATRIPLSSFTVAHAPSLGHFSDRSGNPGVARVAPGNIVELRVAGSLFGYALATSDGGSGATATWLTPFDFLAPDELRVHDIGEQFWTARVMAALRRRRVTAAGHDGDAASHDSARSPATEKSTAPRPPRSPRQQPPPSMLLPTHAPAGTSAIRLIHGAADGLPHIYVDRLGERSVWVGCTCAAFARCALPAVVRAIDAALLPVEVLVSMPFDVADTVADGALGVGRSGDGGARDGSRRHGAGRRHPQLLTGLLSDARIGSAELPHELTVQELGVTIPRSAGTRLPFDLRARSVRRFLRDLCVDKFVVLVACDVATALHCQHARASRILFCCCGTDGADDSGGGVTQARRWLGKCANVALVSDDVALLDSAAAKALTAGYPSSAQVIILQLASVASEEVDMAVARLRRVVLSFGGGEATDTVEHDDRYIVVLAPPCPWGESPARGDLVDVAGRAIDLVFAKLAKCLRADDVDARHGGGDGAHAASWSLSVVRTFDSIAPDYPVSVGMCADQRPVTVAMVCVVARC